MGKWGIIARLPTLLIVPPTHTFCKVMSKPNIFNSNVDYHDNSKEYNIDARGKDLAEVIRACESDDIEDITPAEPAEEDIIDSKIFTKKAIKEHKEAVIIAALKKSVNGRKDKTRAFVDELQSWQDDGYVDAHYNAKVMYDELCKLLPISFGYEVFKKHYNNTRS